MTIFQLLYGSDVGFRWFFFDGRVCPKNPAVVPVSRSLELMDFRINGKSLKAGLGLVAAVAVLLKTVGGACIRRQQGGLVGVEARL